jgi:putative FmdB family regulatory protein
MPIYEYQCTSCHHQFDILQKINEEAIKVCPECHKETAIKLVSAAGFQLKGSGWYVTDFKNKNNAPAHKSSDSAPSTEAKNTATPETKSIKGGTE